jgi:predicted dehydrogenase
MSSRRYNIGVIGYGLSAKVFHIPLILTVPDFKLHAIVQRSPKPDNNAEKDHPDAKVWRSADEMVQDEKLDVVVVTTAPDTHLSLAKLALEAGKHGVSHGLVSETSNGSLTQDICSDCGEAFYTHFPGS